jgi:hypothetical protein
MRPARGAVPWGHGGKRLEGNATLAHRRGVPGHTGSLSERRGLTPPSRTGGKRGGRRGASAGPPSRPPCIPPPRPPAGARRIRRDEEWSKGSLFRPLPIPCGDGTRGAGSCREVLCSGGRVSERFPCSPRAGSPGQVQFVSAQAPHKAGLLRILPVPPLETKPLWLGRLARPRLGLASLVRLASPRLASPHAGGLHEVRSPVATTRARPASSRQQPRGSRPRRGWARGGQRSWVYASSRPDASCTSGGPGWGNARGAGRGAGTGPPAPAPLAAGARGWR